MKISLNFSNYKYYIEFSRDFIKFYRGLVPQIEVKYFQKEKNLANLYNFKLNNIFLLVLKF